MFEKITHIRNRMRLISGSNFSNNGRIIFAKNSNVITLGKFHSEIDGMLSLGFPLPGSLRSPSYDSTVIKLGNDAELIIKGDVYFANGCQLIINSGGRVIFHGNNHFDRNTLIYCTNRIEFGEGTRTSWNCSFFDSDNHNFYRPNGEKLRRITKPLEIGDNVGIQMNVVFPTGCKVGDNS